MSKRSKVRRSRSAAGRPGFPKGFFAWTPQRRRLWLKSKECDAAKARGILLDTDCRAVVSELDRHEDRIRAISPTWERAEECERLGIPFPPLADTPNCRMRRAKHMLNVGHERKTYWPTNFLTHREETYDRVVYDDYLRRKEMGLDEQDEDGARSSMAAEGKATSASVTAAMEVRNVTVEEYPIKVENEKRLKAQIARHLENKRTNLMCLEGRQSGTPLIRSRK